MKLTSKLLIITVSIFITFCGSPVDNNSDGSYE